MSENEISLLYKAGILSLGYVGAALICAYIESTGYLDVAAQRISKVIINKFSSKSRNYKTLDEEL